MRIQFYCDSGANIHSMRTEEFDMSTEELGISEQEWKELSEKEREKMVREWAYDRLEYGYKYLPEKHKI